MKLTDNSIVLTDKQAFERFMYSLYKLDWMQEKKLGLLDLRNSYIEYMLSIEDSAFASSFEDYVAESNLFEDFCKSFDEFVATSYTNEELMESVVKRLICDSEVNSKLIEAYRSFVG